MIGNAALLEGALELAVRMICAIFWVLIVVVFVPDNSVLFPQHPSSVLEILTTLRNAVRTSALYLRNDLDSLPARKALIFGREIPVHSGLPAKRLQQPNG